MFLNISPQKLCIKIKVLQNTAKPKSINMQKISGKIHFDTTAIIQNNAIWKWTVITFVQCKLKLWIYVCLKIKNTLVGNPITG